MTSVATPTSRRELFELRAEGHRVFDCLWTSGAMNRNEAYRLLARCLGIDPNDCHWRFLTAEQCRAAIEFCRTIELPRTFQKRRPIRRRRERIHRRQAIARLREAEARETE